MKLPAHTKVCLRLIELAQLGRGDTLIDVGSGGGTISELALQHQPTAKVTAIEPNPASISRLTSALKGARIVQARAEELGQVCASASADIIAMANCIHLLDDVPSVIRQVMEVLVGNGRLAIATSYLQDASYRDDVTLLTRVVEGAACAKNPAWRTVRSVAARPKKPIEVAYTTESLRSILLDAGLLIEREEMFTISLELTDLYGILRDPRMLRFVRTLVFPGWTVTSVVRELRESLDRIMSSQPQVVRRSWWIAIARKT